MLRASARQVALLALALPLAAQEAPLFTSDFPAEEFAARRAKVMDAIGRDALALVQGAPSPAGYVRFRQSNELFYLAGIESPHAYLLIDGFVYGLDDGILACLDPATGERKWKAGRYGHGQMILVERTLLVQTEEGELVLVDPSPDGLKELARFDALGAKTWNPPALAAPYLLVRNDKEAACYELPLDK